MADFRNTLLDLVSVFGWQLEHLSPAARARIRRDAFGGLPPAESSQPKFLGAWEAVSFSSSSNRCIVCAAKQETVGAYAICPRCGTSCVVAAMLLGVK
ncbi:hypothetical protein HYZ80_01645 [Candidatus Parcubacteria bacterium]|nr:hypothetical protein [Candidatus Parcubacteria bacterium]